MTFVQTEIRHLSELSFPPSIWTGLVFQDDIWNKVFAQTLCDYTHVQAVINEHGKSKFQLLFLRSHTFAWHKVICSHFLPFKGKFLLNTTMTIDCVPYANVKWGFMLTIEFTEIANLVNWKDCTFFLQMDSQWRQYVKNSYHPQQVHIFETL